MRVYEDGSNEYGIFKIECLAGLTGLTLVPILASMSSLSTSQWNDIGPRFTNGTEG